MQSLVPDEMYARSKLRMLFFAVNPAGGEPKVTVTESEFRYGMSATQVAEDIRDVHRSYGTIFEMKITGNGNDEAVVDSQFLTQEQNDVFWTKDKIICVRPPDKQITKVYTVSVGCLSGKYFDYRQLFDAVIDGTVIGGDNGQHNGRSKE
jgi:hypothetical protein